VLVDMDGIVGTLTGSTNEESPLDRRLYVNQLSD